METTETIRAIKQLFFFHKQATAKDDEYTKEIYEYLIENHVINLTDEDKLAIFADAKVIFAVELTDLAHGDDIAVSKSSIMMLRKLKINQLPKKKMAYLGDLSRMLAIKKYFDSIEKLPEL